MSKLWVENGQSIPAVSYQDTSPTGSYSDMTEDLVAWNKYWSESGKDYMFSKDKMIQIVSDSGGFSSLDTAGKIICCTHQIGTIQDWVTILTTDQIVQLGLQYRQRITGSAQIRLAYAEAVLKSNFLITDVQTILIDANVELINFIMFGVVGKPEHSIDGVKDYIRGVNKFAGAGLCDKTWTPHGGMTIQEACDQVYDIAINGNY